MRVRVTIPAAWFVHEMHALALARARVLRPEVMRFECRGRRRRNGGEEVECVGSTRGAAAASNEREVW